MGPNSGLRVLGKVWKAEVLAGASSVYDRWEITVRFLVAKATLEIATIIIAGVVMIVSSLHVDTLLGDVGHSPDTEDINNNSSLSFNMEEVRPENVILNV